ncbi:PDZ and LIM domain protein 7-like [Liolophura sinensis]|uniref:PDZ and LIM domain protein 7-like n=1 Tax=Liolophura sinensis TaxID=3198878 RepID=UPI0031591C11
MASPVVVQIQRSHMMEPWGFRLQGGQDFRMQLSVKKVAPGSPADGRVGAGDIILGIGNSNAQNLTHMQAHQLIKSAGQLLQLTLLKGQYKGFSDIKPKGPVKFSPWKH